MTYDAIAQQIIREAQARGYDPLPPLATAIQESGLRPGIVSPNGKWIGIYQQDTSYSDRNNPTANIQQFFDRLDAKRRLPGWSTDLWLNIFWLQQRPGEPTAQAAYQNGRQAYLTEIKSKTPQAQTLIALYAGGTVGWTGDPIWLETVLREALGDRLVVDPGWKSRGTGRGENGTNQMGPIWGVMIHHTGNSRERPETIRDGVWQTPTYFLPGPLSQCLIRPDGTCHLVAVGPCNHAGTGSYPGIPSGTGNTRLIGFECAWPTIRDDGTFDRAEKWPDAQIITMRDATAAVLKRLGKPAANVIGHKDYSDQGKWDPGNIDMNWFRSEVAKAIKGDFQQPAPTPEPEPTKPEEPPVPEPAPTPKPLSAAEDNQLQLRGPGLKGWPQLGNRTLVDAVAAIGAKLGIDGFKDKR